MSEVGFLALPRQAIRWVQGLWYARCRKLDIALLWPECVGQAPDIDLARCAFACHAFRDPAWLFLGHDEIYRVINALEPPR